MSARSVWSGTRPSRYHSVRLISAPPRRPEHCTRMPRTPAFWAFCTARFMARRKFTRPASWSATPWAISAASSSGCLISWMFSWTLLFPVILASSALRRSASAPLRQVAHQLGADLPVLDDEVGVLAAAGEPARLPVRRDAEAEPVGVDLLSHY